MIIQKVTIGFVVQRFDTETRKFVGQEFISSDDHTWENRLGEVIEEDEKGLEMIYGKGGVDEPTYPLDMIQPK